MEIVFFLETKRTASETLVYWACAAQTAERSYKRNGTLPSDPMDAMQRATEPFIS